MTNGDLKITGVEWPNRVVGQVLDLTGSTKAAEPDGWFCRLDLETHFGRAFAEELGRLLSHDLTGAAVALATNRKEAGYDPQLPLVAAAMSPKVPGSSPPKGGGVRLPLIRGEFVVDHGDDAPCPSCARFILEIPLSSVDHANSVETLTKIAEDAANAAGNAKAIAILTEFLRPVDGATG